MATNCNRLKLITIDGKMRLTDVADTEQLLRLIQSIPSPIAIGWLIYPNPVYLESPNQTLLHRRYKPYWDVGSVGYTDVSYY